MRVPTADADPLEAAPYLQELTSTHVDFMWQTFEGEVTGLDLGLPDGRTLSLAHDSTAATPPHRADLEHEAGHDLLLHLGVRRQHRQRLVQDSATQSGAASPST